MVALALLYSWSQAHERTVLSWSNGLVWWALGSAATPLFFDQSVSQGNKSGQWIVRGEVQTIEAEGRLSTQMSYEAQVELRCPVPNDPLCWHLEGMMVEDQPIEVGRLASQVRSESTAPRQARIDASPGQPAESGSAQDPMQMESPSQSTGASEPQSLSDMASEIAEPFENDRLDELRENTDEPEIKAPISQSEREVSRADEPVQVSNLQESSTRPPRDEQALVVEIQQQLAREGFETGPIDGLFGPLTSSAIAAYQTAIGRPVNGQATEELLDHLLRRAQDR